MFGIYIHWPYCLAKCPYCDFNSHVAEHIDHSQWQEAYRKELSYIAEKTKNRTVTSIFFGGGTPSLMHPKTIEGVIQDIHKLWPVAENIEITMEANPTSVEQAKFQDFKTAGINRVSLGIQSLRENDLKFLGRQHNVSDALNALETAQSLFDRTSFDLIYARPNQTPDSWQAELEEALSYAKAGHLSLYQLTIEPGTAFETMYKRRDFEIPDDDISGELYELTDQITMQYGLPRYEISNYARNGEESQHNLTYWRYEDYAGIGPGAHGRLTLNGYKYATRAHRAPGIWMKRVWEEGNGYHPFEELTRKDRTMESILMGLRLKEGMPLQKIEDELLSTWKDAFLKEKLTSFVQAGYIEITDTHIGLTSSGFQRLEGILHNIIK